MVKKNACIFISGEGSNFKNLLKRSRDYNFPISIKLIISNNPNAKGIIFARRYSIPYLIINTYLNNFENTILNNLNKYKINIICLAGYMKIISKNFLRSFKKRVVNIHPSLLPKFKGLNTFKRILKEGETKTGCTVHFVDETLDGGKIITQKSFYITSGFNELDLKKKTQMLEYVAYPEAIIKIFRFNY